MAKIENLAGTVRNLQLPQIITYQITTSTSLGAKFVEFLPYDYKELANIFIITSGILLPKLNMRNRKLCKMHVQINFGV